MEIRIRPTDMVGLVDGVPSRVWLGLTDGGVNCYVIVRAVAPQPGVDVAAFERELRGIAAPEGAEAILPPPQRMRFEPEVT